MFRAIQDWRENVSWNLGRDDAEAGKKSSPPWWADKIVYSLGFRVGEASLVRAPRRPI